MKNWTVKEAAKVIRENKDTEAIKEIVKHFPLFAVIVAAKDFDGLTDAMPEHMTVRKLENELNNGSTEDADTEDGEDQADEAGDDTATEDLENMSTKQLIVLCDKRGIKVPKYGKNKQFYLDALNSAGDEDTDAEETEEEEEDPIALYKKCKKAGLKVAPKKSAKYYKDQLAKAAQAEEDADVDADADDEDDWDDEEDEEKPAKKTAKKAPAKKGAKKPAKKAEPEEDDEEDDEDEDEWDI